MTWLSQPYRPKDHATAGLFVYVDDCDKPLLGKVKGQFGHCWGIATHKLNSTPEEIGAARTSGLNR